MKQLLFLLDLFKKRLWLIPVLAGLGLRLTGLTYSSIWHDEGYTMWLLKYDFIGIIERTARDVHPPMYYLLAKPWIQIFSNSAFSIRFLSILFSIGTIFFAYRIVEKMFNERAALYTGLLIAVSPFMVRFGQEARMYGVVAFFTTLATYFLVRYFLEKKNKLMIFYAISMILAAYTQYYAFFVLVVHWLVLLLISFRFSFKELWRRFKKKEYIFSPAWWLANIVFLIVYLPWFYVAYKQVTRVSGSYWIQPEWITKKTIPANILQFITYSHLDGLNEIFAGQLIFWLIVLLLFIPLLYLVLKEKKNIALLILAFGLVPMILVYVLSEIRTPVYQDRYFPFSAIGIFAFWGIRSELWPKIFGIQS